MINNKKSSIVGDTIILTISKITTLCITMISAMLLSRFRTLEEYGTYSQLMMIISLSSSLFMLGLPNSINYFLARSETNIEKQKFLNNYYTFTTILSILLGILLIYTTPVLSRYFKNKAIKSFIYFLGIYPWTRVINSSIENILIVYQKTCSLALYKILNSTLLLLIIIIVKVFSWTFEIYMVLLICVESIFTIIVYYLVNKYSGELKISIDVDMIKSILKFSIPIGLASVIGTINIELDKLIIGNILGTEQLAIYTNAAREMPVTIIATSITSILLPQITRLLKDKKNDEAILLWGNATTISYAIICFLAIGFFVFAKDVMILLYSDKYLEGIEVFRVYNLLLLLRSTYFGMILNCKGKTKFILYSSITALILNCVLNYGLFILIGFNGPAIATLLSQMTINIAQLIYTSKIINIKFSRIFPWKELRNISLINMVFGMIFYNIKNIISIDVYIGSTMESIILGIIWGFVYVICMRFSIMKQWNELKKEKLVC